MDVERSLRSKITWRLIAPLTFLIFLSSVDRSNIALAALQMNQEIGLSPLMYGRGAGLFFFAGYILLQYPHTSLLKVLGARRWVTGAVVVWGAVAAVTAFIQTPMQFYIARFVLGAAEGGFAAGATTLATLWMPRKFRAAGISATMLAVPLSQILGAPLSGWLMTAPIALGELSGWRMMIALEGLATMGFGCLAWFCFVDRVDSAPWLDAEQRALVARELAADEAERPLAAGGSTLAFLGDLRFWIAAGVWFCLLAGSQGIIFWMAQVVKQVAGGNPFEIGVISAMPWVGVGLGMFLNARSSDRRNERHWHLAAAAILGAGCLLAAYLVPPGWVAIVLLMLGGLGLGGAQGVFWPIPLALVSREATAAGVTVIAMVGNTAGLIMTPLIGLLRQQTGAFGAPIYLLAAMVALASVLVLALRRPQPKK